MATYYDVWDVASGNCIGTFDTQDEALEMVAGLLEANGDNYADDLDLGYTEDDHFRMIASGLPLMKLAHDVARRVTLTSAGRSDR